MSAIPLPLANVAPLFGGAAALVGAGVMIAWRVRETSRPVTTRSIIAPPLGMSTGLAMFAVPATRIPVLWALLAFLFGWLVLAIPVARSSRLVRQGDQVLLERSRAFLWILLALVAVRFGLRAWVEHHVSPMQTGAILFLLALGMILRWRLAMLLDYRRLLAEAPVEPPADAR